MDKNYWLYVAVGFLCLLIHDAESVMCKICREGYEDLNRCTKVGKCVEGSICYTEVTFNSLGQKLIYAGCRSRKVCEREGLIAKRDTLCLSCCETDFCNSKTCGLKPPTDSVECLSCDNVETPEDCETTELCSSSQDCMTEYRYAGGGKGTYRMGCESSKLCDLRDEYIQNFTRKAARLNNQGDTDLTSEAIVISSILEEAEANRRMRREIDDPFAICLSCCPFAFCNRKENCLLGINAIQP